MIVNVPWQAWYGDFHESWDFPVGWQVQVCPMAAADEIDEAVVTQALNHPIATPALRELAKGRDSAVIVVEDITRPAPTAQVLPAVLSELYRAGLDSTNIRILIGLGAHAPMTRPMLIKKLGPEVVEKYEVVQHHAYINVTYMGETRIGTPVYLNDFYLSADLRLAVGSITPHGMMGFGGGAKTVSIGVAGIETIAANHNQAWDETILTTGLVTIESNAWREDLEEIARIARLEFILNGVVNAQRELAGIFAGDPKDAHRAGISFARSIYRTALPEPVDILVLNAYPKDTDLIQAINALNAIGQDADRVLSKDGTLVIASACSLGAGIHSLVGVGIGGSEPYKKEKKFSGRDVIIYSPNLSPPEVKGQYPPDTPVFKSWAETISELKRRHGDKASAAVYPNGAIQIPPEA